MPGAFRRFGFVSQVIVRDEHEPIEFAAEEHLLHADVPVVEDDEPLGAGWIFGADLEFDFLAEVFEICDRTHVAVETNGGQRDRAWSADGQARMPVSIFAEFQVDMDLGVASDREAILAVFFRDHDLARKYLERRTNLRSLLHSHDVLLGIEGKAGTKIQ